MHNNYSPKLIEVHNSKLFIIRTTKDNNHIIDFTNVKILDTEINRGKRLSSESVNIQTQKQYMNKLFKINRLPNDYTSLLENFELMRLY